jgi:hypothetical protein
LSSTLADQRGSIQIRGNDVSPVLADYHRPDNPLFVPEAQVRAGTSTPAPPPLPSSKANARQLAVSRRA